MTLLFYDLFKPVGRRLPLLAASHLRVRSHRASEQMLAHINVVEQSFEH